MHNQEERKMELRDREQDATVLWEIGYTLGLAPGPGIPTAVATPSTARGSSLNPGILKLISRVPHCQCRPGTDIPFGSTMAVDAQAPAQPPGQHDLDDADHDPFADLDTALDDRDIEQVESSTQGASTVTRTKDARVIIGDGFRIPGNDPHATLRNSVQFSNAVSSGMVARTYQRAERHAQLAWKATRSQ
eukprot:9378054-Pyramimonas_sp.AAC.1